MSKKITNKLLFSAALLIAVTLQANCAFFAAARTVDYPATYIPRAEKPAAIPASTMKLWNNRHVQADLEQAISELTAIANANPGDYDSMVLLCRAHYLMADGHLYLAMTDSNKKEINKQQEYHFDLGVRWCEKALATNKNFYDKVVVAKAPFVTAVDDLTIKEIDALYWRYGNLAKWSRLKGLFSLLENKPQFSASIDRVEKLNKNYFYGAVLRYRGAANFASPTGNKKEGAQQFEASIKQAPNYFGTKVLYADLGLRGDEEKAIKLLNEVINGNPRVHADIISENILEQKKAEKLLKEEFN
jgi:hypothetical protein